MEATLASILPLETRLLLGTRALGSYIAVIAEVCPVPASIAPGLRLVFRAVAGSSPRMPASSTHLAFAAPVEDAINSGFAASHPHRGVLGIRTSTTSLVTELTAASGPDPASCASPRALASLRQYGVVHEAPPHTLLAPRSGARVLRWMATQLALGDSVSTGSHGRSGGLAVGLSAAKTGSCGADVRCAEPSALPASERAARQVDGACDTYSEGADDDLDDARKRRRGESDDGEGGGGLLADADEEVARPRGTSTDALAAAPHDGAGAPSAPPPTSQRLETVTALPSPRAASAPLLTRSASLHGRSSTLPPRAAGILGAATADDVAAANLAYRSMRSRRKSVPGASVNAAALFRMTAMLQQQSQYAGLGLGLLPPLAAGPYDGMPFPSEHLLPLGLGSPGSAAFVPGFVPLPPEGSPGNGHA